MSQTVRPDAGPTTAELYVEVQQFYAHQMPLLEDGRIEEFVLTFTEDGTFEHAPDGWRLEGREQLVTAMRANIPRYGGSIFRHWFDKLRVEAVAPDTLKTSFAALVSVTDAEGKVTFEPTSTVSDVLVREDGVLHTRARVVGHDIPNPARFWGGVLED